MAGIKSVRMTNPEADCYPTGPDGVNHPNVVTVTYLTTAAATPVTGFLCQSFAASQKSRYGDFSVQPSRFKGILNRVEQLPNGPTATPHTTNYDITLHPRSATMPDITDGGLANMKTANASLVDWNSSSVLSIRDDIYLKIHNLGSSATYNVGGQIRLYFE